MGHVFWSETDIDEGSFSVGLSDGKNLAFRTRLSDGSRSRYDLLPVGEGSSNKPIGHIDVEDSSTSHRFGIWKLNDNSAGTFEVVRKNFGPEPSAAEPLEKSQAQISNKEVPLGAITLYRADLERIIAELSSYFEEPFLPLIRAKEGGQVFVRNAGEYLARRDLPERISELTISIEKPSTHGLKKIVNLILNDDLDSKISVSSPDELWTEAVAQRLSRFMSEFTSTFTGFLRRHGLNVNSLLLVAVLIALPEFRLLDRILIVGLTIILMFVVVWSHKLVPYARIYLDPEKARKPYSKELPSVILGIVATLAISALSALPKLAAWISNAAENLVRLVGN